MFTVAIFIFFYGKFLNECKSRTTLYTLWQPGPPGLAFYGSGSPCLPSSRLAPFHAIRNFLANQIYHFSRLSHQTGCLFTWTACSVWSAPYSATLDHEITLKILEFIFNLIEKVKPSFSLSSVCMFPESNGTKS